MSNKFIVSTDNDSPFLLLLANRSNERSDKPHDLVTFASLILEQMRFNTLDGRFLLDLQPEDRWHKYGKQSIYS